MDRPVKEVRFAVVMYGGVSLAVYINGVSRELLSLVRATAPRERGSGRLPYAENELTGAEPAYRKLARLLDWSSGTPRLRADGWRLQDGVVELDSQALEMGTRFVVDILSGTSAGGINAIYLAKALANNQDLVDLSRLWKTEGDIAVLLNDKEAAREPDELLDRLRPEVPPSSLLNSRRMYLKLLAALRGMEERDPSAKGRDSPLVDELNLHITATDLEGLPLELRLADKPAGERKHRAVFRFIYASSYASGEPRNDFLSVNDPLLAFAARATSSFPVAFDPMTLADVDALLERSPLREHYRYDAERWKGFFRKFRDEDYPQRPFGDGGYLDNKPFSYATESVTRQRSDSLVDRKLVYIEPAPETDRQPGDHEKPDALENAMAAAVLLPRYETIREDLEQILQRNRALRQLRRILLAAGKRTASYRTRFLQPLKGLEKELRAETWIRSGLREMEEEYGVSYVLYHQLRVELVLDNLARLAARVGQLEEGDWVRAIRALIQVWKEASYAIERGEGKPTENRLLYDFDLSWRQRRLGLLRQRIDGLYRLDGDAITVIDGALSVLENKIPALERQREILRRRIEADLDSGEPRLIERKLATLDEYFADVRKKLEQESGPLGRLRKIRDELAAPGDPAAPESPARDRFRRALLEGISPAINSEYVELRAFGRRLRSPPAAGWESKAETEYRRAVERLRRRWARQGPARGQLKSLLAEPAELGGTPQLERARELLRDPDLEKDLRCLLESLQDCLGARMRESGARVRLLLGLPSSQIALPDWLASANRQLEELGAEGELARTVCATLFDEYEYYDMVSLPLTFQTDLAEADEIEIFRISPCDATSIVDERSEGVRKLAGTALGNFGAFLEAEWRDNDMLWGRLDAAERLITAAIPESLIESDARARTIRRALIEEAQEGILQQELPPQDLKAASRLLSETLSEIHRRGAVAEATSVTDLRRRLQRADVARELDKKDIYRALRSATRGRGRLRDLVRAGVPRKQRPLPPQATAQAAARASRVFGQMLEGITDRRQAGQKASAWFSRIAQLFWALVVVSMPGSLARLFTQHILKLVFTLLVLMVAAGMVFGQEEWVKTALIALGAATLFALVTFALERLLRRSLVPGRVGAFLGRVADRLEIPAAWRFRTRRLLRRLPGLAVFFALAVGVVLAARDLLPEILDGIREWIRALRVGFDSWLDPG